MDIGTHAAERPTHPALVNAATGAVQTFGELEARSNRLAQYLYAQGLRRGDHIALFMENNMRFLEIAWAALRSGLYFTAVNRYLTADEAAYIVEDCDAAGAALLRRPRARSPARCPRRLPELPPLLMVDGAIDGWDCLRGRHRRPTPPTPRPRMGLGEAMLYSSGTTGRPKGILRPLPDDDRRPKASRMRQLDRTAMASRATRSTSRPRRSITPRRCGYVTRPCSAAAAPWS